MGASPSKTTPGPSHVWKSETPVRFSQELVDSLQASTETDSTRAKTLELHIQQRVQDELKRLQAREEQTFADLAAKLSSADSAQSPSSPSSSEAKSAGDTLRNLGRESIQREVQELKKKLESRKQVKEIADLDKEVERAREDVIACLRGNDRRPLDCWKEVEGFRDAVRQVEGRWVEKIVR